METKHPKSKFSSADLYRHFIIQNQTQLIHWFGEITLRNQSADVTRSYSFWLKLRHCCVMTPVWTRWVNSVFQDTALEATLQTNAHTFFLTLVPLLFFFYMVKLRGHVSENLLYIITHFSDVKWIFKLRRNTLRLSHGCSFEMDDGFFNPTQGLGGVMTLICVTSLQS